jgi:Na+/H+ antiporter NhaC
VLILALVGVNVIIVLIGGTVLSGIIGLIDGSFGWKGLLSAVSINTNRYGMTLTNWKS